ncbi:MAG: class I SAM-dependent DNA methyltransferase, partial [Macromonas bipunctata]|nr:class I SAM-dependent DNA methyltransferase [Macromonas bipunctata]
TYNPFPWPGSAGRPLTAAQRRAIASAAQAVLDARARFPASSLADLYDPLAMPAELLKAHQQLDKAVDAAYGYKPRKDGTPDEAHRVAFLFGLYQALLHPLDQG